jgi:RNA polymerase sigma-70 factor (ECF subfamily)
VAREVTACMLEAMESLDEDAKLMVRYRDGDADAFSTLYARHKGPLYRYLLRQVRNAGAAADLFQDVWSRLVATRSRYEARAKFATYLFHIAHNCTIDFFRRDLKMRRAARSDEAEHQAEPEVPEYQRPDGIAEFAEQQSALLAALGALPQEQREAFLLHEETGLTIEEIARVTDVGVETAKSRLRYAIRKLKKSLLPAEIPVRSYGRERLEQHAINGHARRIG